MECLFHARQLHTFSHLCFKTALKYSSSNSTGRNTRLSEVEKPAQGLVRGQPRFGPAAGPRAHSLNHRYLHKVCI